MNATELKMAIHFLSEEPRFAARKLEQAKLEHAVLLLRTSPPTVAANVFKHMLPQSAAEALVSMDDDNAGAILSTLSVADISAILRHVEEQSRMRLLELLPMRKRSRCLTLLTYPSYTVGALIETDALVLESSMRADEALLRAKKRTYSNAQDVYVLGNQRQVVGTLSLYALLQKPAYAVIEDFMGKRPPTISGYTEISAALSIPAWLKTDSMAVVNRNKEYVGIIHHYSLRQALSIKTRKRRVRHSFPVELVSAYGSVLASLADSINNPK